VASIDSRKVLTGTQANLGVIDAQQTSAIELIHVKDITSGEISEAIELVYDTVGKSIEIYGRTAELASVNGRMTACDKALVRAVYGNQSSPRGGGNDPGIEFDITTESTQWVRTPILGAPGKLDGAIEDVDAWQTAANKAYSAYPEGIGGSMEFDVYGNPNGDLNVNAAGRTTPYALPFRVVRIRIQVEIVSKQLIEVISRFGVNIINDTHTTLLGSGAAFEQYSLRFDGAQIKQRGRKSYGVFQFSARKGPWLREYLIGADHKPVVDGNGDPVMYTNADDKKVQKRVRGVAVGKGLAHRPVQFSTVFQGIRIIN
jgi:hypothetical protein